MILVCEPAYYQTNIDVNQFFHYVLQFTYYLSVANYYHLVRLNFRFHLTCINLQGIIRSMKLKCSLIILVISFYCSTLTSSQVTGVSKIESAEIEWVGQIPSQQTNKNGHSHFSLLHLLKSIIGINRPIYQNGFRPVALVAFSPENVWVLDQLNEVVEHMDHQRLIVPACFSKHVPGFQSLVNICLWPGRGLLFSDSRLNKLFLYSFDKKRISAFADNEVFHQPTGVAFQKKRSECWIVETALHQITILDSNGHKIRSIGQRGNGDGEFNFPTSVWIDSANLVYVVDALNHRIQLFDGDGHFIRQFGKAGNTTGSFALPKSVATDSYGDIYVVDALSHAVQIFDQQGNFLLSFGSQGRDAGKFWLPSSVYIDQQDMIYVADSYNARVQIFKLDKIVFHREDPIH